MKRRVWRTAGLLWVWMAFAKPALRADSTEAVVVRVGTASFTGSQLTAGLLTVPPFQRATLGATDDQLRRSYIERVLLPRTLLEVGASARNLAQYPATRLRMDHILRDARVRALRAELAAQDPQDDEVRAYWEEHRAIFESPPKVEVWRILCPSREKADLVLAAAKQTPTVAAWEKLARESSVDSQSAMRGGRLGLLLPDGQSSWKDVHVDPAVVAAVSSVKDGELVPRVVEEGQAFAVIWRRGSAPAVHRSQADARESIRDTLVRMKLAQRVRDTVSELRAKRHVEENPKLLDDLQVGPFAPLSVRPPSLVAPRVPDSPTVPQPTPRGLR